MLTMDVFTQNAFSSQSLLAAIEKIDFKPSFLTGLGIFDEMPLRTRNFFVEEYSGVLNLIQSTPVGAPLPQRTTENRTARSFSTVRIAKGDHMMAEEVQGVRAFGSETELMELMKEIMRRLAGPAGILSEIDMTLENLMLGAVQGIILDADASTIYNLFTEFNVSQPAEVAFDFGGANKYSTTDAIGLLRKFIQSSIVRPMLRAAKGVALPSSRIIGLCGDNFFDDLTAHGEVRTSYLNTQQAIDLRGGNAFESFNYGGVTWINYRGTDDASTVTINTDKAKFFFAGAPGLFKRAMAPAEFMPYVNTPGRPVYPMIVPDPTARQAFVDIEAYAYTMFICTRPLTLYRGKRGA